MNVICLATERSRRHWRPCTRRFVRRGEEVDAELERVPGLSMEDRTAASLFATEMWCFLLKVEKARGLIARADLVRIMGPEVERIEEAVKILKGAE